MKKTLQLLRQGFESSSGTTPQFLSFVRTFRSEITKILKAKGCTNIEIGKGHFYISGFFTAPSGQVYYLSLSDVRTFSETGWNNGSLMYRTAKDYKDYTGGCNQFVKLDEIDNVNFK